MANMLKTGSSWLLDQMKTHASVDIVYERGIDQVPIKATIGRTVFEIEDGHGVLERTESRDFLVQAADLVIAGATILPERGDRIRETVGTITYVYEVMAPGKEPHWRYSDPFRKTLRIHTKQIDTE